MRRLKSEVENCLNCLLNGSRLLPISLRMRRLKSEVENCLNDIIEAHRQCLHKEMNSHADNLLGLMLTQRYHDNEASKLTAQQLMDECKTFFFAGQDTTALLLAWTLMLLAAYPSWQEMARREILNICVTEVPDAKCAGQLKIVSKLYALLIIYRSIVSIWKGDLHAFLYCNVLAVGNDTERITATVHSCVPSSEAGLQGH